MKQFLVENFNLSNILAIIAIIIAVFSIKISRDSLKVTRDSLVFSQRSMLIKDSYEPILEDIKHNKSIDINSSQKLNFGNLQKISDSYLYLAFEERDRQAINSILELEDCINSFKNKADSYASQSMIKILNRELEKVGVEEKVLHITITDSKGKAMSQQDVNLYDILLKDTLAYRVASNDLMIYCETGNTYTVSSPEGYEYDTDVPEYQYPLPNFLEKLLNEPVGLYDVEDGLMATLDTYEKKIINELKNLNEYNEVKSNHQKLLETMGVLEAEIVNRIKELIIPKTKK
jgi:hypothetical protein